jgi:tetratricopeptide (TPR) repeat protein
MSTVSLQIIVKDEFRQVALLIQEAIDYVDEINLTVSDKTTANKLTKVATGFANVNVKYREWNDRFDDARNANYAMSTTDFTFWVDADDSFDFSRIPDLVAIADKENLDAIFLPYNYARDGDGNIITRHYRERLVRNGRGFTWRGWVHETLISDEKYTSRKIEQPVEHLSSFEHAHESVERNHAILQKAYDETKDPRYLLYLGMSEYTHENHEKAASLLSDYLEVGGSIEDSYRAMSVISECAYHLGRHDMALEWATKAMTLKPEYPMAYWLLAQYEADQDNWEEALEWVKVSLTKPDPDTLSVFDPSARERAVLIAAQGDFMLGNYNKALAWLRKIPKNKTALTLFEDFQKEADAETFLNLLPRLRKYFYNDNYLYEALVDDIKYDTRIRQFRNLVTKPNVWDKNTIVIFCGQGYEEWGPHTLDKGMGGSEEAVVYLSRELANIGYTVTVFGEVDMDDHYVEDEEFNEVGSVRYRHWKQIDTRDQFNIFISWRAPQYLEKINAKVKIADIHDVLPEAIMKDYPDVTYFVKTAYHRSLTPRLPDDKFRIIGNGIKKEQFHAGESTSETGNAD